MPSMYCTSCGTKNEYQITKPVKCVKCSKPFAGAFKAVAAATYRPVQAAAPIVPAYVPEVDDSESDDFDGDAVQIRAQQLLSSINASDFVVTAARQPKTKLGDIINKGDA